MLQLNREATSQGHSCGGPYPIGAYPNLPSHSSSDRDVALLKEAIPEAPNLVPGSVESLGLGSRHDVHKYRVRDIT